MNRLFFLGDRIARAIVVPDNGNRLRMMMPDGNVQTAFYRSDKRLVRALRKNLVRPGFRNDIDIIRVKNLFHP